MHLKLKVKEEYFLALFVMLGLFFYLGMDKLPLTHPGNIKAADPFYHTISVESILDTKQWNYYDYYLSLGNEKVVNHQPPLIYTAAAMLSEFTKLPAWVSLYFLVCLSQALFIILVYLITYEAFENKKVALIAAGLSVLPAPVTFWLYGVYIGFWLQVPSYFFIVGLVWLTIKYIKTGQDVLLLAIGFSISSIILLHLADIMVVFFEMIAIGFIILIDLVKRRDFISFFKRGLLIAIAPAVSFLTILPRIVYIWSGLGTSMFTFGIYPLNRNIFPKEQYGGMVWPHFDFFPAYIKILFFLGMIVLLIVSIFHLVGLRDKRVGIPNIKAEKGKFIFTMKREKENGPRIILFFVILGYFATIYLSPLFFSDPYYLGGRARALQPFFIYPVVAYAVWLILSSLLNLVIENKKGISIMEISLCLAFVFVIIWSNLGEYNFISSQLKGEHITYTKWNMYTWIQDNTPKEATLLFFGGIQQGESIYTKRICAVMSIDDLDNFIQNFSYNNRTPEKAHVTGWCGNTLREGAWKIEKSFFSYSNYTEYGNDPDVDFFDYIVFQNFANEIVPINQFFANEYSKKGYSMAYNDGTSVIMKNERRQ